MVCQWLQEGLIANALHSVHERWHSRCAQRGLPTHQNRDDIASVYGFGVNDRYGVINSIGCMSEPSLFRTTAVQIKWLNNMAGQLIKSVGETGFQRRFALNGPLRKSN